MGNILNFYHLFKGICEEDTVQVTALFSVSMLSDRRYASGFQLLMDLRSSNFEITNIVISYQVCDHTVVGLCTHVRVGT